MNYEPAGDELAAQNCYAVLDYSAALSFAKGHDFSRAERTRHLRGLQPLSRAGCSNAEASAAKAGVQLRRYSTRLKPCPPKVDVRALSPGKEPLLIW
jgi:hypothetical protein